MNTYIILGIFGIISSFVAALADVPLVKPGKPDSNGGVAVNGVNPWWADVTSKRFKVAFWLSFLGQPGTYITMWLLADLISSGNEALALALRINTFIGCYTGLLCHTVFCLKPLLYQKLSKKMSENESLEVLKVIDSIIQIPTSIGFLTLWRNDYRSNCDCDRSNCRSEVVSAFESDCFADCFNDIEEMRS